MAKVNQIDANAEMSFNRAADSTLLVYLSGSWTLEGDLPSADGVRKQIEVDSGTQRLAFDASGVTDWDSGLVIFLKKVVSQCAQQGIQVEESGLPEGVQRLIALSTAVPEKKDARKETGRRSFLSIVGENFHW
jgi:phospholipid/cholesterol/gamma-HCH transport system permease protein